MEGTSFSSSQALSVHDHRHGPAFFFLVNWLYRFFFRPVTLPALESKNDTRTTKPSSSSSLDLLRAFNYFDENGDGKISPSELRRCMHMLGQEMSDEEAAAAVQCTDSDGDGLLGFDDFMRLVEAEGEEDKGRNLREAFKVYEMDGQGCITPSSLSRTLGRLGEDRSVEECGQMIRRFDLNGDGVLSFDEFKTMMLAST